MVSVSASVNLPLHHKVQKFSSGTGSPGWSRKKGRETVVVVVGGVKEGAVYMLYIVYKVALYVRKSSTILCP